MLRSGEIGDAAHLAHRGLCAAEASGAAALERSQTLLSMLARRQGDMAGALSLIRANLYAVDLIDADLSHANLCGANFYMADLRGANFDGADLRSAFIAPAQLASVKLTGATRLPDSV